MRRRRSILLRLIAILLVVAAIYSLRIAYRVVRSAEGDPLRKADAIVVFGAAEYAGRPSPVLKARLDHALDLYQQGYAPVAQPARVVVEIENGHLSVRSSVRRLAAPESAQGPGPVGLAPTHGLSLSVSSELVTIE